MTKGETVIATIATGVIYVICPEMTKWQTVAFLIVVFGCVVCVIWGAEELRTRIRRARRIARRKRRVFDINLRSTGLVEDGGKEVQIVG